MHIMCQPLNQLLRVQLYIHSSDKDDDDAEDMRYSCLASLYVSRNALYFTTEPAGLQQNDCVSISTKT